MSATEVKNRSVNATKYTDSMLFFVGKTVERSTFTLRLIRIPGHPAPTMIGRLHFLTDTEFQTRFSLEEIVLLALQGGADTIQFRQKSGTARDRLEKLRTVKSLCETHAVTFIVNDYLDLALAAGADGVHLGQDDLPIETARGLSTQLATEFIIGATVTTREQAVKAEAEGADYLGFGPVFETSSKKNPAAVKGTKGLSEAVEAVRIPVVAIAGITVERVADVLETGAHGIAVMTAISTADDPENEAQRFTRVIASKSA